MPIPIEKYSNARGEILNLDSSTSPYLISPPVPTGR